MRAYLQHHRNRYKRSGSSCFDEESILRTEGTTHASGMAYSGAIPDDLVNTVPLMLHGL